MTKVYYLCTAVINHKKMNIKNALAEIIHERLKTKSELDALRFISESKGYYRYESLINMLLDKLNFLNKLEKELNEQLNNNKE